MKKNYILWKRHLLAGGMLMLSLGMCGCSPQVTPVESFRQEAGEPLLEDINIYATFKNEKKAAQASLDLSRVDINQTGIYEAKITLKDQEYPFKIEVVDTTAPTAVLLEEEMTVELGTQLTAKELLKEIKDCSEVTAAFVTAEGELEERVTLETEGEQELVIRLTDAGGNQTDLTQKVKVIVPDTTAPVIQGTKNLSVYEGNTPDYLKGITAEDETDGDLTAQIQVDSSTVDVKKSGSYQVTYRCSDAAGNETEETVTVTVKKKAAASASSASTAEAGQTASQPQQSDKQQSGSQQAASQQAASQQNTQQSNPQQSGTQSSGQAAAPSQETEEEIPDHIDVSGWVNMTPEEYDDWVANTNWDDAIYIP